MNRLMLRITLFIQNDLLNTLTKSDDKDLDMIVTTIHNPDVTIYYIACNIVF